MVDDVKEYLIPLEDIPVFLTIHGISIQDLGPFLMKKTSMQTKETLDNFKDAVTPEQYAKTMARFKNEKGKEVRYIVSDPFDRLYYTKLRYALLRYGEKTTKGKDGKAMGKYADAMKHTISDINFDEPIKLTQKDIELLKADMESLD